MVAGLAVPRGRSLPRRVPVPGASRSSSLLSVHAHMWFALLRLLEREPAMAAAANRNARNSAILVPVHDYCQTWRRFYYGWFCYLPKVYERVCNMYFPSEINFSGGACPQSS